MAYEYFISYRRNSGGISQAGEIRRILVECVGEDKVFRDLESIKEGPYPEQIQEAIAVAKHFILIVNQAFFKEEECPDDWFFKEITQALSLGKDITPIIFDGVCPFDDEKKLPEDLKKLGNLQRLVYSKDNATHFDLFLKDHLGIKSSNNVTKSFNFDAKMWKNFVLRSERKNGKVFFFIPNLSSGLDQKSDKDEFDAMIKELIDSQVISDVGMNKEIKMMEGETYVFDLIKADKALQVKMVSSGMRRLLYYELHPSRRKEYWEWKCDSDYFDLTMEYVYWFHKFLNGNGEIKILGA